MMMGSNMRDGRAHRLIHDVGRRTLVRVTPDHHGIGITATTTQDIWRDHPEKVLGSTLEFARNNPNTCRAMMAAIIEAGKARSLAIMAAARNPAFPDVPTLKEAMGIDYSTGAWRGIAGPKGLPADVSTKLTASLKKVFDSKEFKDFMSNRGFGTVWGDAAQFETFMDKGDAQMGVAMKAAGLSKA